MGGFLQFLISFRIVKANWTKLNTTQEWQRLNWKWKQVGEKLSDIKTFLYGSAIVGLFTIDSAKDNFLELKPEARLVSGKVFRYKMG